MNNRIVETYHGIPYPRTAPSHDCAEYYELTGGYHTEPHGESFWDEWLECAVCGHKASAERKEDGE